MYANRDRNNRPTPCKPEYCAAKRRQSQTPPRWSLTVGQCVRYAVIALAVAAVAGWVTQ